MNEALDEGWISEGEETEVLDIQAERLNVLNLADREEAMRYFFGDTPGVLIDQMTHEEVPPENVKSVMNHVEWIIECERVRLMGECTGAKN